MYKQNRLLTHFLISLPFVKKYQNLRGTGCVSVDLSKLENQNFNKFGLNELPIIRLMSTHIMKEGVDRVLGAGERGGGRNEKGGGGRGRKENGGERREGEGERRKGEAERRKGEGEGGRREIGGERREEGGRREKGTPCPPPHETRVIFIKSIRRRTCISLACFRILAIYIEKCIIYIYYVNLFE